MIFISRSSSRLSGRDVFGSGLVICLLLSLLSSGPAFADITAHTTSFAGPAFWITQGNMAKVSQKTATKKGVAITRSFFLPGMGQHYKGQHKKGFLIQAAFVAVFAVFYDGYQSGSDAADKYDVASAAYDRAIASEEIDRYFAEMDSHYQDHQDAMTVRNAAIACAGLIWAYNLYDAARGFGEKSQTSSDKQDCNLHGTDRAGIGLTFNHNVRLGVSIQF